MQQDQLPHKNHDKYALTRVDVRLYLRALEWEYENGKALRYLWKRTGYR
jgi:hypothetical protein